MSGYLLFVAHYLLERGLSRRYACDVAKSGADLLEPMTDTNITHQWVSKFDADTARAVVSLVDCASSDGGPLGYAQPMSPDEADVFITGLKRRVTTGEAHVLLGRAGVQLAFLGVLTCNGMTNCRHRAELSKGVVHPEFRGRRFVQLAFQEMVRRAADLGVDQFVLDVREGSRAHVLWQRFGFESYGILNDYARIGGKSYPGHFMVQSVASLSAHLSAAHHESTQQKDDIHV